MRRVVVLAHHLLPTGRCSLATVAEVLGIQPRTLQGELHSEGQDFRGILDQARRELVADSLGDTQPWAARARARAAGRIRRAPSSERDA